MSFSQPQDPGWALTEGVLTRRVVAWIIDVVLIGAVTTLAWVVLTAVGVLTFGFGFGLMAMLPLIPFAYHVLFVGGSWSATPGEAMLDLAVRREDDLGQPSLLQAVVFTVGLWIALGSFFVLLLIAPFMPRKRAPHDIVAGLVVVRKHALTRGADSVNMAGGTAYR